MMNSCGTDYSRCIKRGPIVKGSEKSLSVLIYTTEKGAYFEFSGIFSEASEFEKKKSSLLHSGYQSLSLLLSNSKELELACSHTEFKVVTKIHTDVHIFFLYKIAQLSLSGNSYKKLLEVTQWLLS